MAEPLKATFYAFSSHGLSRGVLRRAVLVHGGSLLATFAVWAALNLPDLAQRSATGGSTASVVDDTSSLLMGLSTLIALPLYFLTMASFEAACLRIHIRRESKSFGSLSLSGDTWRVWFGQWMWWVLCLVLTLISGIILGSLRLMVSNFDFNSLTWLLTYIVPALIALPIALRLAPGNAASVGRRKFSYFLAWRVTSGRFFALAGAYVSVWLIWLVTMLGLVFGIGIPVAAMLGADNASPAWNAFVLCLFFVSTIIANMLVTFLLTGINARAVLVAAREGKIDGVAAPNDVAEVFS